MKGILSIIVDATHNQSTHVHKCEETFTKISTNEQNLGVNIITVYPIFEALRKNTGYEN